jgi:hypothetical protein
VRAKEKFRRRERLEQYNEEYRLHEQWGLSPLLVPGNSSSEEEESDGGQAASNRWNPPPPSPRVEEVAVELVPMAGAEALATGSLVEAPACATEVPPQAFEEEEAGFLQLEVSSISPRAPLVSRDCCLFLLLSCG